MITAEQFEKAVGRPPENDDLDRCNCPNEGEFAHFACGWCKECQQPRFICGHMVRLKIMPKER